MRVYPATWTIRILYAGCLAGILAPYLLGSWAGLALSAGVNIPLFLQGLLIIAVCAWRLAVVFTDRAALDSPPMDGLLLLARHIGVFFLAIGTLIFLLRLISAPMLWLLSEGRSDSGVELFVISFLLSVVSGAGILGIGLFEFSRLRAFELRHNERD